MLTSSEKASEFRLQENSSQFGMDMDESEVNPGKRVRVISDPSRVGHLTGEVRVRGGRTKVQVSFTERSQFLLLTAIEIADENDVDIFQLLKQGRFGRASDLRKELTYIMLNGRLANLIYSMNTTNTDFYPHQFKPVLNFLDSPSNGILIADEVGLGKTIEAGLIWTEIRSRFDARRLLVVCPAMLREKWQSELQLRFGITAELVNAGDLQKKLAQARTGTVSDFALIVSMQGIRPPSKWEPDSQGSNHGGSWQLADLLHEEQYGEPLIDLVVIDEAHYMRNPETSTAKMGKAVRHVSDHVVLLSATPINLKSEDLFHLLNIVDEDNFNQVRVFNEVLDANSTLTSAREHVLSSNPNRQDLLEALKEGLSHPLLENNRQLRELVSNLPSDAELSTNETRTAIAHKLERMNLLGFALTRTRKRDVQEWRVVREAVPEKVSMHPIERKLYSEVTNIVREFCDSQGGIEGFLLVMPQRQVASSMAAAVKSWQERTRDLDSIYEDFGADAGEPGPLVGHLMSNLDRLADFKELRSIDSKYQRLHEMLSGYIGRNPGEKVILFSYFKPTLRYLAERLEEDGISNKILMGGFGIDKQSVIDDFRTSSEKVLLASEVASEGVDLQFSRVLINYDLPWNPMKVEQRIGRIDRIGQKAESILIWNLMFEETIDSRIYERLYSRIGIFEGALGGLEVIIGEEVRTLTKDLMSEGLSVEQENSRIDQTAQAISNIQKEQERLEEEAPSLMAHGQYILNEIKAADELGRTIKGGDLWVFVRDFVREHYQGCEFQQLNPDKLLFDVRLSPELRADLDAFLRNQGLIGKTRLAAATGRPTRCEFMNKVVGQTGSNHEVISQLHPLVKFVAGRISSVDHRNYPLVAVQLNRQQTRGIGTGLFVFFVQQWSLHGARDIERLSFAARELHSDQFLSDIDAERLITTAASAGIDWVSVSTDVDLDSAHSLLDACLQKLDDEYEIYVDRLRTENEDRLSFQEASLRRHLTRQQETLETVKRNHEWRGRDALVKATEGKIRALEERFEQKLREIETRRQMTHNNWDVSAGLIKVA